MPLTVKCPRCSKLIVYSKDNPYRPFCSERCKLIDLGNWADGTYSIVGKSVESSTPEHSSENENENSDENAE